ncbi:hypothetical protein [Opitutus terrae]|uniref:Uncharacterized protein n=1 Tax=Opitutus terrae (strain DSM 11246 / JCM 15787 / PB90-1) TaxID=452637 RepID=B1ZQC0_OPITP|nr:hypothetical protein [Opitutus terrae]ACB73600.1 hypothetical protein Oter_0310 [Opitutus terrae PB90-1]
MNANDDVSISSAPRGFRRVAPAFALFFLSPFVAEMLLGDFAIDAIWIVLVVGPLYGGGAVIVRETARRLGRGWATLLLLALAYGIFEEGIVIQTLFNPNYLGLHLLRHGYVPALGMSAWWTPFVLTLHTVWSISVPIAIVEALFPERRTQPWLGRIGLGISAGLMIGGALLVHGATRKQDPFTASNVQLVSTWIVLALVVILALRCRPKATRPAGAVPGVWVMGALALLWGLGFMSVNRLVQDWLLAGAQWALDLVGFVLLVVFARRAAWTPLHTVAVAGGAMLAYACHGFPQEPVAGSKGVIDLVGNTLFAIVAVVLLVLAARKERALTSASHAP